MRRAFRRLLLAGLLAAGLPLAATATSWTSPATGRNLPLQLLEPTAPRAGGSQPLVFYLVNLAAPRTGTEPDEDILRDLRADGYLVAVLDYAGHPAARWPHLNRDLAELRRQLHRKILLADRRPDPARIYIIPSGHRLKRDVVYARDGQRALAMDIIYPSRPVQPVGALLEFSCDNVNRMGNYSLQYCSDTILEGAATEGFAVAMADHPVAAPYEGLDAMPGCALRIKAAVRTLRAAGPALGLTGRIVPVGFSRGSGLALMLVTTAGRADFEGVGEHAGVDSGVQGAVVLSGRFTYLDLLPRDHMLPLYEKTWGRRSDHLEVWRTHGALDHLTKPATVPLFLSINVSEAPDALHQMEVLRRRLDALGSPFTYQPEQEARGHKMPLDPAVLDPLHRYLSQQLSVAPEAGPASHRQP
jgi:acetyl esterase/lipase